MKIVKGIFLHFAYPSSVTTQSVNIPFGVKFMKIVSSAYEAQSSLGQYLMLFSDMSENQPISILNQYNSFTDNSSQDILIEFSVPKIIQGNYTFTMFDMSGKPISSTGDDYLGLIIEFYDENSFPPRIQEKFTPFLEAPKFH